MPRRRPFHPSLSNIATVQDELIAKARRLRRRGEMKKALTALREACLRDERAAWLWTLWGALSSAQGKHDDARRALRHALWLRESDGDDARAATTQALIDRLGICEAA